MSKPVSPRLDKILAMADSGHDNEAVVAVRMARQMLSRDGLSFTDLARAANKPRMNLPFGFLSSQHVVSLETEILQMRQEMEDLRRAKARHEANAETWRQRAAELEHRLVQSLSDANRWQKLARDAIKKLRDLGLSSPSKTATAQDES